MTGQNDRPDESLTGQVHDQAGHCPLTGRYFEHWHKNIHWNQGCEHAKLSTHTKPLFSPKLLVTESGFKRSRWFGALLGVRTMLAEDMSSHFFTATFTLVPHSLLSVHVSVCTQWSTGLFFCRYWLSMEEQEIRRAQTLDWLIGI